jgi:metal-sulfur cluster biosynthetic enzyme
VTADPLLTLALRPRIIDAICSVYDPEIPVNIWELGLIYGIDIDDERRVHVQMTLTAPGCPSAQALPLEVERKIRCVEGVADARLVRRPDVRRREAAVGRPLKGVAPLVRTWE